MNVIAADMTERLIHMSCISGDLGTLRLFIVDTDHNEQVHEKVTGVQGEHGEIMVCAVTYTSQPLFQLQLPW